jgi:hypothetical protein
VDGLSGRGWLEEGGSHGAHLIVSCGGHIHRLHLTTTQTNGSFLSAPFESLLQHHISLYCMVVSTHLVMGGPCDVEATYWPPCTLKAKFEAHQA